MNRKGDMRSSDWIPAYENRNLQIDYACGLGSKAQIGRSMWAAPDRMADMMVHTIAHATSAAG